MTQRQLAASRITAEVIEALAAAEAAGAEAEVIEQAEAILAAIELAG